MKVNELKKDILNIPSHTFGEHKNCKERGDNCEHNKDKNYVPQLKSVALYEKVEEAVQYLSQYSDSLLHRLTNNAAEAFNSLIAHELGGKRINWGLTNQYDIRVSAAALDFNTQQSLIEIYKAKDKKIPRLLFDVTSDRKLKVARSKERRRAQGRKKRHMCGRTEEKFYGSKHEEPDKTLKEMDDLQENFFKKLEENQKNRKQIEQDTIDQRDSPLWQALRRNVLTASKFKIPCTWNINTSCVKKVKEIIYPPIKNETYISYGVEEEKVVKQKLSKKFKNQLINCGLIIDQHHAMSACSPDALIGEDGLLEIKCTYGAANMTAQQAIKTDKNTRAMFDTKNINKINKEHEVYYQIQGQLHITGRNYCMFVIHTPHSRKLTRVNVDHDFLKTKMESQLIRFYMNCLLPELVDSRHNRN